MNDITPGNELSEPPKEEWLPIAETFHSLQGEGTYAGTPMHFIRLAGCSVGQRPELPQYIASIPILKTNNWAWKCHTYDGRAFWCDTDFGLRERLGPNKLLDDTWESHICLTGGEPFVHRKLLEPFIFQAKRRGIQTHIETSGTINWPLLKATAWIAVSPKLGVLDWMISRADELKLLIDPQFDLEKVPVLMKFHPNVYIQPINQEMEVDRSNVDLCLKLLRLMPNWKLSVQLHKFLGVR